MNSTDFESLAQEVRRLANDNKKYGIHLETITMLAASDTQCIYELLQNADDASATEVQLTLSEDALKFSHDGKAFVFEDVKNIIALGESSKKDDITSIGKFGVGFKSVFRVTETPEIYSGEYNFRITDLIVPERIQNKGNDPKRTTIKLPFLSDKSDDVYEKMSKGIKSLAFESLLFLRNIEKIRWETKTTTGSYLHERLDGTTRLLSVVDGQETMTDYVLFCKEINISGKRLNLSVAYKKDADEENAIVPVREAKVFVFFPTTVDAGFQFLVHAPYKTNLSRETIPFEGDENAEITEELAELIAESIDEIKDKGLLGVNFLSLLPIESESTNSLYKAAFEKVKKLLYTKPLLPTIQKGEYVVAENALLSRRKGLANLLDAEDCAKLFSREYWIDTDITRDKTLKLHEYLKEQLGVSEIGMDDFCRKIDEDFIKKKPDEWLIKFYSAIVDSPALYRKHPSKGILLGKPIIRLDDNSHVCPENEHGVLQIYRPTPTGRDSQFKTIKRTLITEQTRGFFDNLGASEPDDVAEIKECIITEYRRDDIAVTTAKYMKHFERACEIWSCSDNTHKKNEIIEIIRTIKFVGAFDCNQKFVLCKSKDVYDTTDEIKMWFQGNREDNIYFLAGFISAIEKHKEFAIALGVRTKPRISGTEEYRISDWGNHVRGINTFNPKFNIDGLAFALDNINIERSLYLFKISLKYASKLGGKVKKSTYKNFPDLNTTEEQKPSEAGKLLKEKNWLYDQNGSLIENLLSEVSLDDLHRDYDKEHENIDKLVKVLELKMDLIKQVEEMGKKVVPQEEYAEFKEWKEKQLRSKEIAIKKDGMLKIAAEEAKVTICKFPDTLVYRTTFSGQTLGDGVDNCDNNAVNTQEKSNDRNSPEDAERNKKIGEWGEKYVRKHLEYEHPGAQVIWLNQQGNRGKGYDFVIKENTTEICYYEVKSTTHDSADFPLSGTQWATATQLYASGNGDKYVILFVPNVGTEQASIMRIVNPVARWKEGKIHADPVRIKLP